MTNGRRVDYTTAKGKPSSAYVFNGEAWDVYSREAVRLSKTSSGLVEYVAPKQDLRAPSKAPKAVRLKMPKAWLMVIELLVVAIGLAWLELTFK